MAQVVVDGLAIHHEDVGTGVPVVLLHGMGASFARNWDSIGWTAALTEAGHRVIGIDARGHGRSDAVTDVARLRNGPCLRDVTAVLDACGIEQAHVVGYSMGAGHALRLGLERPHRVLSLSLGGLGGIAMACAGLYVGSAMSSRAKLAAAATAIGSLLTTRGEKPAAYAPLQFEALQQDALERGALESMAMPVLVAVGDRDTTQGEFAALAVSGLLAARIPGARRIVFAGETHLTAPAATAFKRAVLDFLATIPTPPAAQSPVPRQQ